MQYTFSTVCKTLLNMDGMHSSDGHSAVFFRVSVLKKVRHAKSPVPPQIRPSWLSTQRESLLVVIMLL